MALEPKFIGSDDVGKLLNPQVLLDRLESALGKMSQGKDGGVEQPIRSAVSVEKHKGFLLVMPGYSSSDDALATKLISFYPDNMERPSHQAWIMLFEPTNGDLRAIIDGVKITEIRTGIVSAIATKHLANPNSHILAIIGTGVQAYGHFEALCLVQHFDEVRVWGRTYAHAQRLVEQLNARLNVTGMTIRLCSTVKEAVTDADVICTVTFATTPVISHDWVKPGAHINAIGACRPDWQELDSNLMRSAVVYTDSREACLKESGDIILSECEVYADIGEVITGQKEALWQQTTVFKSVGVAIEDVISAKIVYDEYLKQNAAASDLPSFLSSVNKL